MKPAVFRLADWRCQLGFLHFMSCSLSSLSFTSLLSTLVATALLLSFQRWKKKAHPAKYVACFQQVCFDADIERSVNSAADRDGLLRWELLGWWIFARKPLSDRHVLAALLPVPSVSGLNLG